MPPVGRPGGGARGPIRVTAPASANLFPLSVSGNGRYTKSPNGDPFLINGESAWFLLTISPTAALEYMDDLVLRGFTGFMFLATPYWANAAVPNYNGDYAFSTPNDFTTTPVAAHWNYVDYILAAAATRGLVCKTNILYYGWQGDGSEGWWPVVATKTTTQIQTYAAWAATRLAAHSNIIWDLLGDYMPSDLDRMNALVTGVRSVSTKLCTGEPVRGHSTDEIQPTSGNWELNFAYAFQATYVQTLSAYNNNVGPVLAGELYYEWRTGPTITVRQYRAQAWFALTSGSPCMFGGNYRIFDFDGGQSPDGPAGPYQLAFTDPGRLQLAIYGAFAKTIPWWDLVPDQSSVLVTAGRGTFGTETYVTAAITSSGSTAVIYVPSGGAITVDLTQMAGTGVITARWLDPTTGTFTAATGSPFAQASRSFTASTERGNNTAGDPDWVLVLTT